MKRTLVAISAVALLSAACGSSGKSCSDACNAVNNCATTQGSPFPPGFVAQCIASCTASTCSTKQQVIDCVSGAKCDAGLASMIACDPAQTCF